MKFESRRNVTKQQRNSRRISSFNLADHYSISRISRLRNVEISLLFLYPRVFFLFSFFLSKFPFSIPPPPPRSDSTPLCRDFRPQFRSRVDSKREEMAASNVVRRTRGQWAISTPLYFSFSPPSEHRPPALFSFRSSFHSNGGRWDDGNGWQSLH